MISLAASAWVSFAEQALKALDSRRFMLEAGCHNPLQPCSRAARKWRENEEMKRKWRENEEKERD